MSPYLLLLFACTLACNVSRELCFKFSARRESLYPAAETAKDASWPAMISAHARETFSSWLNWLGIGISIVESTLWLLILEKAPLILAYPILSLDFCLIQIASRFVLKEEISLTRWIGAAIISLGVALIGIAGI